MKVKVQMSNTAGEIDSTIVEGPDDAIVMGRAKEALIRMINGVDLYVGDSFFIYELES